MDNESKQNIVEGFKESAYLSARTYNIVIGLFLLWGFIVTDFIASGHLNFMFTILQNWTLFIIFYFVMTLAGSFLIGRSKSVVVRIIAYHIILIPIGLLLTLVVSSYDSVTVGKALGATASIAVLMTALSVIMPNFFLKMGRVLFVSLVIGIIAQLVLSFATGTNPIWIDWLMVVIFAGFIGYDWAVAQRYPMTVGNAVYVAASVYIDIVNIFLRLLSIFGRKR